VPVELKGHLLDFESGPVVMGILNVTPDSFYDGGKYRDVEAAVARARAMAGEGARIIDVGGESTRPGSDGIPAALEIERLAPVVERLVRELDVPISIDTRKAKVAEAMLSLGAHMVNDVSGLAYDGGMADVVAAHRVPVVLMHMRGTPRDMQQRTGYDDVVTDVKDEILARVDAAESAGISRDRIIIDPGIGFSKTAEQSAEIIARLDELIETGYPVMLGPSRKSFMGKLLGLEPEERLEATIATCVWAMLKGVSILRVHDVGPVVRALGLVREVSVRAKCERAGSAE
jgi:dihydropteroate synthase